VAARMVLNGNGPNPPSNDFCSMALMSRCSTPRPRAGLLEITSAATDEARSASSVRASVCRRVHVGEIVVENKCRAPGRLPLFVEPA
jgi:hypothetical protein